MAVPVTTEIAKLTAIWAVQAALLGDEDWRVLGMAALFSADRPTTATVAPLLNREGELTGAMVLLASAHSSREHVSFVGALSGTAADIAAIKAWSIVPTANGASRPRLACWNQLPPGRPSSPISVSTSHAAACSNSPFRCGQSGASTCCKKVLNRSKILLDVS